MSSTHISSFMFKTPHLKEPVDYEGLKKIANGKKAPETVDVIDMETGYGSRCGFKKERNVPITEALRKYG